MSNEDLTPGSVWQNKDPYEGEGEIIIGQPVEIPGHYECIKANCTKYPSLNGTVEWKHESAILTYYNKISD